MRTYTCEPARITSSNRFCRDRPCPYPRAGGSDLPNRNIRTNGRRWNSSRKASPDSDPTLLYSNFEFIADDGSVNEVDALVITRAGLYLVEIKSRGGILTGNRHSWDWEKDGHTRSIDSPLILSNAKARKLADIIGRQKVFRKEARPWVEALVFLSAPGISVRLPESEGMRICEREPRDKGPGILPRAATPGISRQHSRPRNCGRPSNRQAHRTSS